MEAQNNWSIFTFCSVFLYFIIMSIATYEMNYPLATWETFILLSHAKANMSCHKTCQNINKYTLLHYCMTKVMLYIHVYSFSSIRFLQILLNASEGLYTVIIHLNILLFLHPLKYLNLIQVSENLLLFFSSPPYTYIYIVQLIKFVCTCT